jgi:hypothetical protein
VRDLARRRDVARAGRGDGDRARRRTRGGRRAARDDDHHERQRDDDHHDHDDQHGRGRRRAAEPAAAPDAGRGRREEHRLRLVPRRHRADADTGTVKLGCIDCHGGDVNVSSGGAAMGSPEYEAAMEKAHVQPRHPEKWASKSDPKRVSSANPVRSYTLLNDESPEFIRFFNPGDLRVAPETCGVSGCHTAEVLKVQKSIMTTTALLWGGAAYNNGIVSVKNYIFGESYSRDGVPQKINTVPPPTPEDTAKGVLPFLVPLPRWNVVQAPDPLRAFEKGGKIDRSVVSEVGNPNLGPFVDLPGLADAKFGIRGLGTDLRISAGVLNVHKSRLNDPVLSFLGTNDHPGDYRSSGCTACHVVYANDREPTASGPYAKFGNMGMYHGNDPTIPKDEPGHPIQHRLTRAIPTSQCMICHMHQPNAFVNPYLGYQWWDYETDGELMWPQEQRYPTSLEPWPFNNTDAESQRQDMLADPEGAVVRGLWNDPEFLQNVSRLPTKDTRFADYHGHGWVFRAVYKQDRQGNLLDKKNNIIAPDDPRKLDKAVHMKDIHAELGMHCSDCHFEQDNHGNGKLYGGFAESVEIGCVDCHGTINGRAKLRTTSPAAPKGGHDLLAGLTPWGKRRFEWVGTDLIQRSMVDENLEWRVSQVIDSIDPAAPDYNERAAIAKTILKDGKTWGALPESAGELAHGDDNMLCYTCHTSWMTSCFGCHLPQEANWKKDMQHFEGGEFRNWTSYNPQVVRYDIFMMAKHGGPKGYRIAPARSSSALLISTTNANRERLYIQQAPVSAEGYSSQAFNPFFGHTVRKEEVQTCTSCHVSAAGDNNAWLAQVLTLGTNFVNFMGRFVWVGMGEDGIEGVAITEWDEPQAVIGSNLHKLAYPAEFQKHLDNGLELQEAYEHGATNVRSLQLRGEYLYTANGSDGLRVFDVANIDNKGRSERIVTAPVSPLGQRAYVRTEDATGVALPTNMPIDPTREQNPANQEQPWHPIYRYAFVSDSVEGLVVVDVTRLGDRDPQNNFLERAAQFNPNGALNGASYIAVAGNYAYILCDLGLQIVSLADPLAPEIVATVSLVDPRAIAIQFRYAFVTDAEGLKVIEVTWPERPVLRASLPISEAKDVYVARTYAYVAAGSQGIAIVDVTKPERPTLFQMFNADGALNDTYAVRVAAAYNSVFGFVADGKNGLRVLQLISPGETVGAQGFSPIPTPRLIATYPTAGPAIALSKGMDRDRAVDESGNQVSVFGRLGARPFTRPEMERMFVRDGQVFTVTDGRPVVNGKAVGPKKFIRPYEPPPGQYGTPEGGPVVQPLAPEPERLLPGRN